MLLDQIAFSVGCLSVDNSETQLETNVFGPQIEVRFPIYIKLCTPQLFIRSLISVQLQRKKGTEETAPPRVLF